LTLESRLKEKFYVLVKLLYKLKAAFQFNIHMHIYVLNACVCIIISFEFPFILSPNYASTSTISL